MANKHTERCSIPLVNRELHIKTAMRHSTPTREPKMERLATPSAGEEVEQLELVRVHAGGM